jgi:hypothetical protein
VLFKHHRWSPSVSSSISIRPAESLCVPADRICKVLAAAQRRDVCTGMTCCLTPRRGPGRSERWGPP